MLKLKMGIIILVKSIKLDMVKMLIVWLFRIWISSRIYGFLFQLKVSKKDIHQSCQLLKVAHIWILGAETLEQNRRTQKQGDRRNSCS